MGDPGRLNVLGSISKGFCSSLAGCEISAFGIWTSKERVLRAWVSRSGGGAGSRSTSVFIGGHRFFGGDFGGIEVACGVRRKGSVCS